MFIKKSAFTLIELLITVSIIGILSGITLALIKPEVWRNRAQDTNRKEDLAVIQGALERWYSDANSYPDPSVITPLLSTGAALTRGSVTYLKNVPTDPDGINVYSYTSASPFQNYTLCATLEEPGPNDTDADGISGNGVQYCVTNPF